MRPRILAACAIVMVACGTADAMEREVTSLNGEWEYVKVGSLDEAPPDDGWQAVDVPGQLNGYNYERSWFRRSFGVERVGDERLKIHFGGVKWNSRVLVNGESVGGNLGGYEPFDVDITGAVEAGENELLVGVCDITGTFIDRETDMSGTANMGAHDMARDKCISPVGGHVNDYGIWDDVKLIRHAPVYVSDVFIRTSVGEGTLTVEMTVTNETGANVEASVTSRVDGGPGLGGTVAVAGGGSEVLVLEADWADARRWSHVDPYLYELVTTVTAGDAEDVLRTRFGFREFEVRGPDFYLNGKKISLLATSWWPSVQPETDEAIRQKIRFIKSANCVAFRTHTQPWRERWYDIADEEGLLMIPEGAVWNDDAFYALDDDRWWDNCALHLTRMVDRDKNRPSVVMWSLENEFYGGRMVDDTPYEERLAEMGRIVKRHDPTRPIMYESDGDPGGVADVIGIHYPHEYPEFTNWPNEADWLENPIKMGHAFTETPGTFEWKKDKPLYIGEFLWIPSSNPNWDTVWFGDEAYRDYRKYHVLAKAESWKQQIIGYRRHGVAGISPWTVVEGGGLDDDNPLVQAHRYAYQPIAAYPREMYRRVFGGTATRIAFDVLNDSFADRNLTLRHGTKLAGAQPEWQEGRANAMGSGDRMSFLNSLMWPVVDQRTEGAYVVQVLEDGEVVFSEEHTVSVFPDMPPQASAPDGVRVGECHAPDDGPLIVDGATRVEGLHDLPDGLDVLVIAPGALGAEEAERSVIGRRVGTTGLPDWVAAGGRAVVLEQQQYPTGTLPAALSEHSSTMTFAQIPAHPLLRGVNSEDLKHWGARTMLENEQSLMILETPHQVTEAEPARHVAGACIPVVVSGSSGGVTHAPLMVVPHGDGAYILCQMAVLDKYRREPAAAILLQNIIDHALNYPGNGKPTALQCEIDSVRQKLDEVRAKTDDLATLRGERDLAQYGALIYASTNADGLMDDGLWEWIEAGGNVLVHGLEPSEYEKLAERLDPTLRMVEYEGPALRATGDDALLYSFTNEDLYWLGEHTGISWSTTPLSTKAARTAFERRVDPAEASAYDATGLELEGKYVGVGETGDHVYFATIGTGKMKIDFPEDGEYVIGIEARGTPAQGAFPLAAVRLDGEPVGTLSIRGEEWDSYATDHTATAGEHEFEVAFINDGSGPGEDRNMYVKTVLVAKADATDRSVFLTRPGALVKFPVGEGSVVIDGINWDTEQDNSVKASRFICGLLTGLGARFDPATGVTVEAENMDPQPGMQHFGVRGDHVVIATSGYVETEVEVASAGRYRVEVMAGGSSAADIYPHVRVSLGGNVLGDVQCTSGNVRPYAFEADLPEGVAPLRIEFTNDSNVGGEDRNLALDKVTFYSVE